MFNENVTAGSLDIYPKKAEFTTRSVNAPMSIKLAATCLVLATSSPFAQDVHPDRTVTFTVTAPNAHEVSVSGDFGKPAPMAKNDAGAWTVTIGPLEADIHSYTITVDGKPVADPLNNRFKPQRTGFSNVFEITGDPPNAWDRQPVARGVVHLHEYDSTAAGTVRRLRVYTPPGYESAKDARYPVLYLFHGSGDNEATWTDFGRAHVILDNLIASGKAQPMLIVMPDGHTMPPVPRDSPKAAEVRNKNLASFEADLLGGVIPLVDSTYRTRAQPVGRAIIGLSMGGNQSLVIGLNHPELFAWVGGMSSAVREPDTQLAPFFKDTPVGGKLRLLWLGCGRDDFLLKDNQTLDAMLTAQQVHHTFVVSPGTHAWPVWRRYLAEFVPQLFR